MNFRIHAGDFFAIATYKLFNYMKLLGGPYTYESGSRVRLGEEPGSD
jgi:hypothetical protein